MSERNSGLRLLGQGRMDEAYWSGERQDGWRGRRATGRTPFATAAEASREERLHRLDLRCVRCFQKAESRR